MSGKKLHIKYVNIVTYGRIKVSIVGSRNLLHGHSLRSNGADIHCLSLKLFVCNLRERKQSRLRLRDLILIIG